MENISAKFGWACRVFWRLRYQQAAIYKIPDLITAISDREAHKLVSKPQICIYEMQKSLRTNH